MRLSSLNYWRNEQWTRTTDIGPLIYTLPDRITGFAGICLEELLSWEKLGTLAYLLLLSGNSRNVKKFFSDTDHE